MILDLRNSAFLPSLLYVEDLRSELEPAIRVSVASPQMSTPFPVPRSPASHAEDQDLRRIGNGIPIKSFISADPGILGSGLTRIYRIRIFRVGHPDDALKETASI